MRARPFPTCVATSPASTTRMPSDSSSRIGPTPCAPWRQTISDHRRSLSTSVCRRRLVVGEPDQVPDVERLHRTPGYRCLRMHRVATLPPLFLPRGPKTKEAARCDHVLVLHGRTRGGEGGRPDPAGLPGARVRPRGQGAALEQAYRTPSSRARRASRSSSPSATATGSPRRRPPAGRRGAQGVRRSRRCGRRSDASPPRSVGSGTRPPRSRRR